MVAVMFGQFINHDLDRAAFQPVGGETMPISVPRCDPNFDK
jgi:hypothetical protein